MRAERSVTVPQALMACILAASAPALGGCALFQDAALLERQRQAEAAIADAHRQAAVAQERLSRLQDALARLQDKVPEGLRGALEELERDARHAGQSVREVASRVALAEETARAARDLHEAKPPAGNLGGVVDGILTAAIAALVVFGYRGLAQKLQAVQAAIKRPEEGRG